MQLATIGFFVLGLLFLIGGAEILVRGASRLAVAMGISPLVVGLTVVAFGTSSPELMVSIQTAISGQPALMVGNVVGSNIFNVLFILGVSALITPLIISQQLIRWDVPLMIGLSLLVLIFVQDASLSRGECLILALGLVAYVLFTIYQSRRESKAVQAEYAEAFGASSAKARTWPVDLLLVAGGLGALALGSRWLVDGAVAFAEALGVSQLVIGLTIVAIGTSLPEVATSIVASIRGERDIAVGNVVGSNIFNILAVLGIGGLFTKGGIAVSETAIAIDIPVMVAVAAICLPLFFTGSRISRWEGALLLGYYIAYTAYLILSATRNVRLSVFADAMLYVVIPATLLVVGVTVVRSLRQKEAVG
ncbi:MAG: calcium/sodium antiporter [Caldilineaceae bacterium]|nr:calcium/sodium antiporter [Caldilineaceae bacterium]HRJ44179.1 calcium/sodium antiporter [Caldilineaceae bacterium]